MFCFSFWFSRSEQTSWVCQYCQSGDHTLSIYLFVLSQYLPSYLSLTLNVLSSMAPFFFFLLLCIETVSCSQMLVCRWITRENCGQSRFLIGLQTLIFSKSLSWSMDSSWRSPDFPIWSPAPHHHDCLLCLSLFFNTVVSFFIHMSVSLQHP